MSKGQLGLGGGNIAEKNEPTLLMIGEEIRAISCGGFHSILYKSDGDLLVFGG